MRVLLISNDQESAKKTSAEMDCHYLVDIAPSGEEGVYLSQVNEYSAVILESTITDLPTSEICKQARELNKNLPIVMIADKPDLPYKINFLDSGADVILNKPVCTEELCAYIRSFVKRAYNSERINILKINDIEIDLNQMTVKRNGTQIKLRKKEFQIFEYLLLNRGVVVQKEKLLENIWEEGIEVNSNTLEVHVMSLRNKLRDNGERDSIIETVYGYGYKIKDC